MTGERDAGPPAPPRMPGARALERECQTTIVLGAQLFGWRVLSIRPARTSTGWETPIQGDAGFPDLTLAHPDVPALLFVELKRAPNHMEPEQVQWRHVLLAAGAEHRVIWVPEQLDGFLQELADRPRAARDRKANE